MVQTSVLGINCFLCRNWNGYTQQFFSHVNCGLYNISTIATKKTIKRRVVEKDGHIVDSLPDKVRGTKEKNMLVVIIYLKTQYTLMRMFHPQYFIFYSEAPLFLHATLFHSVTENCRSCQQPILSLPSHDSIAVCTICHNIHVATPRLQLV